MSQPASGASVSSGIFRFNLNNGAAVDFPDNLGFGSFGNGTSDPLYFKSLSSYNATSADNKVVMVGQNGYNFTAMVSVSGSSISWPADDRYAVVPLKILDLDYSALNTATNSTAHRPLAVGNNGGAYL